MAMDFERRPPAASPADVTGLLVAWGAGDRSAGERLLPAVYAELRRQAARAMRRETSDHTLQATALVHEAYLRLVDQRRVDWRNRAHFFGVAAQVMRRILVDHARSRRAAKRGGGVQRLTLGDALEDPGRRGAPGAVDAGLDVLALHEALERLAVLDPDQARLVELRYFGGLTVEQTADALGISPATVKREWAIARGWLRRELGAS
ncbi:MAG TPA: sigma-70 family RNA polymerase sigma factor [Gemmatimonadaceae bacterium]|nr:sigma-70 family RNA polymerase sigma factor [Gemmatimonadaceae bacterium]